MEGTMETITHYTAYRPRPFTKEQRATTTLLYGGLTWKHERLIQGVMHNLGYNAEALPNVSRADLDTGKELNDVGACCPTTFTTGNIANFLKTKVEEKGKDAVLNNYVFFTAGACGPCRFGQYHESYTMALDGLGLRDFRIFLMAQNELDQGSKDGGGFEVTPPLSIGIIWAILISDLLTDLEYQTRPYEVNPGQTDRVLQESIEYLYDIFRNRPRRKFEKYKWKTIGWHLVTDYFTNALRQVKKKWDVIEVDRLQVKSKVKITGEFWLQTHEGDGNYNIKRWLEQESSEVIPPPIAVWLDYLMYMPTHSLSERRDIDQTSAAKMALRKLVRKIYHWTYNRFRGALGYLPYELPSQEELAKFAAPYYYYRLDGGEGHMLIGKALHAYLHKKAHMICELTPYSCMPNTMSIGAMANVLGRYPDLLYAPIEVKGDAEVHALSRCQMILTEAKKRAQREYKEVMEKTGLSLETLRTIEARSPDVKRATYRVPHNSYVGTAANYIHHLAKLSGMMKN
jgi:predicted nucleotide-binding protein (sugar kinase/HSP70/actin superfamily)